MESAGVVPSGWLILSRELWLSIESKTNRYYTCAGRGPGHYRMVIKIG